jgi:hypothetical protein
MSALGRSAVFFHRAHWVLLASRSSISDQGRVDDGSNISTKDESSTVHLGI